MQPQTAAPAPAPRPVIPPVHLRIAGANLLLSGRFEQWVPLVMTAGQQGETEGAAQILVDVTSTARDQGRARPADLLTFRARSVEQTGPQVYQAKGTLNARGATGPATAVLQSPEGHTPFLLVTLSFDRERFGELWQGLEDRVLAGNEGGKSEVRPRAWLRAPELAAA